MVIGSGASFVGVFRTISRAGVSFINWTRFVAASGIRWRSLIFAACFSGSYDARLEISGFSSSRDGRFAVVGGSAQLGTAAGFMDVLRLRGHRTYMVLVTVRLLLRRGTRFVSSS